MYIIFYGFKILSFYILAIIAIYHMTSCLLVKKSHAIKSINHCVLLYVHFSFAIFLVGKIAWFVFLVFRDCLVAPPRGALSLFTVCNCGIS